MTTTFGTDTAYSAISDYYLNLAPSCDDTIFGTNINYCDLVKFGIKDGGENDPLMLNAYQSFNNSLKKSFQNQSKGDQTPLAGQEVNIYDIISEIPELSIYKSLLDQTGWDQFVQVSDKITLFAPTNTALQNALNTWLSSRNIAVLRDLLKAHTLPYKLEYEDVQDRLLLLNTLKPTFKFYFDDTNTKTAYPSLYTNTYELRHYKYPIPESRIQVVKTFEAGDTGKSPQVSSTLYIIDGLFNPISI